MKIRKARKAKRSTLRSNVKGFWAALSGKKTVAPKRYW